MNIDNRSICDMSQIMSYIILNLYACDCLGWEQLSCFHLHQH